jgi:hypothetical protein
MLLRVAFVTAYYADVSLVRSLVYVTSMQCCTAPFAHAFFGKAFERFQINLLNGFFSLFGKH